ncbi:methyltransferase domain-containing protein [Chromobacterium paludis]|uniref:methyltransferase domain-containing protein n=1 Tax=Chromobacterium paludis TaxID=2605945 RepID=UPI0018C8BBD6|nr:methyltransferase domain-containing protein [Chromobacterium paludis]
MREPEAVSDVRLGGARDAWLARWLPMLRESCAHGPVLEIGCGEGEDSATLMEAGLALIAFDLSAEAVAVARRAASSTVRMPGNRSR